MLPLAATAAATLAGCPLFPADFTTNRRIDHLPVAAGSDAIVGSIGLDDHVHADFGSGRWQGRPIGIPFNAVSRTRRAFTWPARHFASDDPDPALPRMGERLRLKASLRISDMPRQARRVALAMKRYGLIVADNGSDWFVSGTPDPRWDNEQLRALGRLSGRDFEVVEVPRG